MCEERSSLLIEMRRLLQEEYLHNDILITLAQPERSVYNTRNYYPKAMMGTSKPVHAGSEPGHGESRVSQMG